MSWIIFGLLSGLVISILDPQPGRGLLGAVVLGVLGSLVGGMLAELLIGSGVGFSLNIFTLAAAGSLSLLLLSKVFRET